MKLEEALPHLRAGCIISTPDGPGLIYVRDKPHIREAKPAWGGSYEAATGGSVHLAVEYLISEDWAVVWSPAHLKNELATAISSRCRRG
jgi:hypothetical protein